MSLENNSTATKNSVADFEKNTGDTERINLFQSIWKGGYYGGDPLDRIHCHEYGDIGLISVNHALYQAYIRPQITSETVVLEIGPGRGAWTRCMLEAKKLDCVDVLSAEHNGFWQYVGNENRDKITYHEVSDASLSSIEDNSVDYIFSFGTFCHISPELQKQYFENFYRKAKPGAIGLVLYANYDKSNAAIDNLGELRAMPLSLSGIIGSLRYNYGILLSKFTGEGKQDKSDTRDTPGRFFHREISDVDDELRAAGFSVLQSDICLNHRDVIVQFRKE
ncbi:MAG: class I SAM-dependent methyltransferase [Pseudomonadota bacterium]